MQAEPYHLGLWTVALVVGAILACCASAVAKVRPTPARTSHAGGTLVVAVVVASAVGWWAVLVTSTQALVVGGLVVAPELVRRWRRPGPADQRLVAPAAVISLLGVFVAVPDTEPAVVAAGVLALPAIVAWRRGCAGPDRWAAIVVVVAVAWAGAAGRPQLIGGLGCVGILVVAPPPWPERRAVAGAAAAAHVAIVAVCSRVIMRWDWEPATVAVLAVLSAVLVVDLIVARPVRRDVPARPTPGRPVPRRRVPRRRPRRSLPRRS